MSPHSTLPAEIDVVRSARRRSLSLSVDAHGRVEVRAPVYAARDEIAAFVLRHAGWIDRKRAEAVLNPPWEPVYGEGGHWYWQGRPIRLEGGGPRGGVLDSGDSLRLPLSAARDSTQWRKAIHLWHQREAKDWLLPRTEALFAVHCAGHRLAAVHWRWMRATWGTCRAPRASAGHREVQLRLNYWLGALPPELAEAVLLHELAHVGHPNHGAGFRRRLAALDPDWQAHDRELRRWGRRLFPFAAG